MDEPSSDAAAAEISAGLPPMAALPLIVGIGASAGGLDPLSVLLARLPAESRCAFVIVQHLQAAGIEIRPPQRVVQFTGTMAEPKP